MKYLKFTAGCLLWVFSEIWCGLIMFVLVLIYFPTKLIKIYSDKLIQWMYNKVQSFDVLTNKLFNNYNFKNHKK